MGGAEERARLREFYIAAFNRPFGWSVRAVAATALRPLLTAEDAEWVLELYFSRPDTLTQHEVYEHLVLALPPAAARTRLVAELRSSSAGNRQAAVKAIANLAYPDWHALIHPMQGDPAGFVASSARALLREKA